MQEIESRPLGCHLVVGWMDFGPSHSSIINVNNRDDIPKNMDSEHSILPLANNTNLPADCSRCALTAPSSNGTVASALIGASSEEDEEISEGKSCDDDDDDENQPASGFDSEGSSMVVVTPSPQQLPVLSKLEKSSTTGESGNVSGQRQLAESFQDSDVAKYSSPILSASPSGSIETKLNREQQIKKKCARNSQVLSKQPQQQDGSLVRVKKQLFPSMKQTAADVSPRVSGPCSSFLRIQTEKLLKQQDQQSTRIGRGRRTPSRRVKLAPSRVETVSKMKLRRSRLVHLDTLASLTPPQSSPKGKNVASVKGSVKGDIEKKEGLNNKGIREGIPKKLIP